MKDLAKKYSEILTKGEVMELFKLLEEVGSLSEACRRAGIDRKTVYKAGFIIVFFLILFPSILTDF